MFFSNSNLIMLISELCCQAASGIRAGRGHGHVQLEGGEECDDCCLKLLVFLYGL